MILSRHTPREAADDLVRIAEQLSARTTDTSAFGTVSSQTSPAQVVATAPVYKVVGWQWRTRSNSPLQSLSHWTDCSEDAYNSMLDRPLYETRELFVRDRS